MPDLRSEDSGDAYRLACLELRGGNRAAQCQAELPGLNAWVSCRPLQPATRGGDLYYLSVCRQGSISRVTLADVAGHGESVNAVAERLRDALREHANHWDQSALIRRLNDAFLKGSLDGQYATAFVLSHYAETGELLFTNAGHLPPLWYRAATREWTFLQEATPYSKEIADLPLGMIPGTSYTQNAVQLDPGDLVLIYTDGINESRDEMGEQLGIDRLLGIARGLPTGSAIAAGQALVVAVGQFRGAAPAVDDETVVALQCHRYESNTASLRMQARFVMPSDPRYLPIVRATVCQFASAAGWDESESRAITLALDEALTNIIRHAYHDRTDGRIELECSEIEDGIEFRLLDQGTAPDPSRICAREVGCDKIGGLGTHIIRDVLDSVSYQACPEGNRFVATKRLRRVP